MNINHTSGGSRRLLPGVGALGVAMLLPLAACDLDEALRVEDPQFLPPAAATPALAYARTIGDFQRAYAGGLGGPGMHDEGYISVSAALSDEFYQGDTFTTRQRTDRRDQFQAVEGNTSDWAYRGLHQARRSALDAAEALGSDDARFPIVKSLEGYTYLALGEGWCGAVPFSDVEDGQFIHDEPRSTHEIFESAVGIFQEAGDHNLARVGQARALLSLGRYAEAGAAVEGIDTDWVYRIGHSDNTTRQANAVFGLQDNGRWVHADQAGNNGLPFRSAMDPRTPFFRDGQAFDAQIDQYSTLLHPHRRADVVLADGVEARLIQAEAALHNGGDWLGILNDLRADWQELMESRYPHISGIYDEGGAFDDHAELEPLTDPGSHAARVDLIFQERGFWLYTRGTRLGDLRRLVREYGRNQADVFPVGPHHRGGDYGADVNFPVIFDEENNPLFNRGQCDVTQA